MNVSFTFWPLDATAVGGGAAGLGGGAAGRGTEGLAGGGAGGGGAGWDTRKVDGERGMILVRRGEEESGRGGR